MSEQVPSRDADDRAQPPAESAPASPSPSPSPSTGPGEVLRDVSAKAVTSAADAGSPLTRPQPNPRPDDRPAAASAAVSVPPPVPRTRAEAVAAQAAAGARVEPASVDVEPVGEASRLPGEHRGGFSRWPTEPVDIMQAEHPTDTEPIVLWAPPAPRRPVGGGLSGWALAFSVPALAVSTIVGWGFPLGIIGVVTGIIALRRPLESRALAIWAIALGAVSIVYSAGWLAWAAYTANILL